MNSNVEKGDISMAKKFTSLLLALILILTLGTTAMAEDTMNLLSVWPSEGGYLSVIAGTDFTNAADMTFSAYTENGNLEIVDSAVLRNAGTSWFVILEHDHYQDNKHYSQTSIRALKQIADMIDDKDDGALVRCDEEHAINVEQSNVFRDTLRKTHNRTDAKELAGTVKAVMKYIEENRDRLMDNVVVIIITACPEKVITEAIVDDIGNTLRNYSYITTHVVVTAARDVHTGDREIGQRLIDKAKGSTVGGTGYMTESLKDDEADKAIQRINNAERRKVVMVLDPKSASSLGHTLTVVQTTEGGKQLKDVANLSDTIFKLWEEKFAERHAGETPEVQTITRTASSANTWINDNYNPPVDASKGGLSTELLIGIIAGVVVLALLLVLLLLRGKKGKKNQKSASQIYGTNNNASSGSSSGGTTITLAGANGAVLKGQMKGGKLTIGRNGAKAMISVPNDGKLSGLHATFTKQGNSMMLTDNGSTNGTKVNGNKIAPAVPVQLQQNDTVTLGSTTYTVTWRG